MMEKLWGDNFFDKETRKWTKKNTGNASCKRGFVQFIFDPIKQVCTQSTKGEGHFALEV